MVARAVAVVVAALVLAGCGGDVDGAAEGSGESRDTPAYGDTLVEAIAGNVSGMIPNITSDGYSHEIGDLIYSGLVRRDGNLKLIGDLASSWQISPDCRDLVFNLRRDVRWQDGQPFTAADVVFTYRTMTDPRTPTAYREDFAAVDSVEDVDPYTVRIHYRQPYAKAVQSWGIWMLPKHVLEPWVRAGRLREAPQNRTGPIGTGPYRFREWKSGDKVVLVANHDYFGGTPYISRVVYRVIPSQATIFLELKAKGVDLAPLTALQYRRQTDYPAFRKAYDKYRYSDNRYTYLGFNLRDPRFADRRVRQAFAYAIDKRELIDGVLMGLGHGATGPYRPGTWAYDAEVAAYPHDPARARRLLAEAGWKETNSEGLLTRNGQPFTFELLTNQGNEERRKVAEIVQAELRDIGVGVEIRTVEWAALLKEYIRKRNFQAIILGWGTGIDPDQYDVWHSSKTAPDELNYISYKNPEVDELLEKGRSSCLEQERLPYYRRLQEVLADDQPIVFLYYRDTLAAVSSRVHGIVPAPGGITYNFPRWFVPKRLQRYTAG